ncbi:unnamed protein product [Owenia fusiformis]|uniref:Uncharacterized protein n=1 Tax=Owenia fusiformis TaxID=6347 RepID=A0A8J1UY10_OWEFU|nr:unnamed protein product [Owenia fusiformis]
MANRPMGYGYTAETARNIDAKYDLESEKEALDWITAVLETGNTSEEKDLAKTLVGVKGPDDVQTALKDGVILVHVMNILSPSCIGKCHPASANKFKHMENIANFLKEAEDYGCARGDLFQSVFLQDGQNMAAVVGGIHALGRKAQVNGFKGPALGPKESQANPREFSEEQLLSGRVHGI